MKSYKLFGKIESQPLYLHQPIGIVRCVRMAIEQGYYALLDDCGLGKTAQLVYVISILIRLGYINRAVVITKADLTTQWKDEFATHAPHLIVVDIHGKPADARVLGTGDVFLANYELYSRRGSGRKIPNVYMSGMLELSVDGERLWKFMHRTKCAMILDESHRIKNPNSHSTKTICALSALSPARFIATATIEGDSPADQWAQVFFLDRGKLLGNSYKRHCKKYILYETIYGRQKVIKRAYAFKNLQILKQKIQSISMRRLKKDCLDLPPKILHPRYMDATGDHARLMYKLRNELLKSAPTSEDSFINVDHGTTDASKNLNRILIAAAAPSVIDPSIVGGCKLSAVMNILDEDPSQLIVWCTHRAVVEAAHKYIASAGIKSVYVYGGRRQDLAVFKNGDARVLVATVDALKEGGNLQMSSHCIYLQYPWARMTWYQSQERQNRIGQTHSVVVDTPFMRQSLDVYQYNYLKAKEKAANYSADDHRGVVMLRTVELVDALKAW